MEKLECNPALQSMAVVAAVVNCKRGGCITGKVLEALQAVSQTACGPQLQSGADMRQRQGDVHIKPHPLCGCLIEVWP
jgi:hypothetical protein